MNISVVCPICHDKLECEYDGTLYGIIAISDLAIMELTTPAEISQHMDSHRKLTKAGFEMDPRYWQRLRTHLEVNLGAIKGRLKKLDLAGLGRKPEQMPADCH